MGVSSPTPRDSFRCWHWDGTEIVPLRGGIPLSDRGFRYGDHLFESVALRGGQVLLAHEHLSLLRSAAARNGFPFAKAMPPALNRFFRGKASALPDGMIRIYLTAGPGGPGAPVRSPSCFVSWEATRFPTLQDLDRGYALVTLKGCAGESLIPWGEKSGNYLAHCTALRMAREAGADEALVTDTRGRAISAAMGNLLVWMREERGARDQGEVRLFTPASTSGARSGAVLGWVRSRLDVIERDLTARDLSKAVAMAVTNSRIGVMPVSALDDRALPDPSLSRELALLYGKRFVQ